MGKRKGRQENPKTLDREEKGGEEGDERGSKEGKGFFACYLLTSLNPRHKGHTYIGFTVNPQRRIRQHNGEIGSGAWRTKSRRPWELVLCIYGFPTNVSALQFEWAWQHPKESLAVRQAAATFKTFSGVANKIKLAYTMLGLPAWQSLNITVNYFSTKYTQHGAVCPSLPEHMKVQVCSIDELPCYSGSDESLLEDDGLYGEEEHDGASNISEAAEEMFGAARVHSLADSSHSIYDTSNEQLGRFEEDDSEEPRGSVTLIVESPDFFNSLMREPSSIVTSFCSKESAEDADKSVLCEEEMISQEKQRGKQSTTIIIIDDDQQPDSREKLSTVLVPAAKEKPSYCSAEYDEVEVIDLRTPSPNCRIRSCTKKRRVSTLCPKIIDLTKSPSFVQLYNVEHVSDE